MAVEPQDRTPAQIEADQRWLAELRATRRSDPRLGRVGGWEEIWDDYRDAEPAAEGRAS
jgi:hypothetical protein